MSIERSASGMWMPDSRIRGVALLRNPVIALNDAGDGIASQIAGSGLPVDRTEVAPYTDGVFTSSGCEVDERATEVIGEPAVAVDDAARVLITNSGRQRRGMRSTSRSFEQPHDL